VVFWQKTEAPANGSLLAESTILPETENCAETEMENTMNIAGKKIVDRFIA
jgi:hypothetical protein